MLDVLASLTLILYETGVAPYWALAPFGLDLIAKTLIFKGDPTSLIDAVIALHIFTAPLHGVSLISYVAGAYLLQKGLLSLW